MCLSLSGYTCRSCAPFALHCEIVRLHREFWNIPVFDTHTHIYIYIYIYTYIHICIHIHIWRRPLEAAPKPVCSKPAWRGVSNFQKFSDFSLFFGGRLKPLCLHDSWRERRDALKMECCWSRSLPLAFLACSTLHIWTTWAARCKECTWLPKTKTKRSA